MRTASRITLALMALAVSVPGIAAERVSLRNDYIEVLVARDDARFTIRATGGSPATRSDDNRFLLYDDVPSTSYTTVVVDGNAGIFGSDSGKIVTKAYLTNDSIVTVWKYRDCEVSQIHTLGKSPASEVPDTVNIAYRIVNRSSKNRDIGIRIMMDTSLGESDGVPYQVPGHGLIDDECEFTGDAVPQYWYSFDDLKDPGVRAMGTLRGSGVLAPDRVVFAAWKRLSRSPWKFETVKGESFRGSLFGGRDSSVALFYNPRRLAANQALTVATLYGLYGVEQYKGSTWALVLGGSLVADDRLPFGLTTEVKNVSPVRLTDCRVSVSLPTNIRVVANVSNAIGAATNESVRFAGFDRDQVRQLRWNLQATNGTGGEHEIVISVSGKDGDRLHTASMKRKVRIERALPVNLIRPVVDTVTNAVITNIVVTNVVQPRLSIERPVTNYVVGKPVVEVFTVVRKPTVTTNRISKIIDLPDGNGRTATNARPQAAADGVRQAWLSRVGRLIARVDALDAKLLAGERQRLDAMIDRSLSDIRDSSQTAAAVENGIVAIERFVDGVARRGQD